MNALAPFRTDSRSSPTGRGRAKLKVALVLTRAITDDSGFGRVKTLREIRRALREEFDLTELRVSSLLETRRLSDMVTVATRWLVSLLIGRPIPLQTILYSGTTEIARLADELCAQNFDAIYFDSVRCQLLMRKVRRRMPAVHMVADLDDLMSRRMEQLALKRVPLSLGFLRHLFPKPLQWLAQGPLSGLLERYEAAALRKAELEIAKSAQAVVLVSSSERDILRLKLAPEARRLIHSVPPPAQTCRDVPVVAPPYRFVFVGSDKLAQNRLSIDFLLRLWEQLGPSADLHIYGRQERTLPRVRGVHWHGYVEEVSDAYTSGSILLLPCLLPGGIKTKVIEAWAFGCPVLGNALAFEGIEAPNYPLTLSEDQWTHHLTHPDDHSQEWLAAARLGNAFVRTTLTTERYATEWRRLVTPAAGALRPNPARTAPWLVPVGGEDTHDIPR